MSRADRNETGDEAENLAERRPMRLNASRRAALREALGDRSIVLVGMMGAGKSSVGRRLARRLDLPFVDADDEIERAANLSIPEIFESFGETYFRDGERKVIGRLLKEGPQVLATGGGAFMDERTRAAIARQGLAIWLQADLSILMDRVRRRPGRPLLKAPDPEAVMLQLMREREPVYAKAPLRILSRDAPHMATVDDIVEALMKHFGRSAQNCGGRIGA